MMVIISPINYCLRALFFVILFAVAFTASPCNGMNMQAANNGIDELEPETFFSSSCNAQNESCESGMAIDHKKKGKIVQSSNIHDNLIEWIQSHNSGFVNEKLEIRLADPIDPTSGSGLFVKERVEEDELLYSIPWDFIIKPEDDDFRPSTSNCGTVQKLIKETKKGEESIFAPYLQVFNSWKREEGPLLEDWSDPGKDLFEMITGTRLPPTRWRNRKDTWISDWHNECNGKNDALSEKAALFVETRSEDAFLIPLYDMANHANGHLQNKYIDIVRGEKVDGSARRTIEAGEQLFHSYNLCDECSGRLASGYGTPELLRDYGFVEGLPQRWNFRNEVRFDLMEVADEPETVLLEWVGDYYPTRLGWRILLEEEDRLDLVASRCEMLFKNNTSIPGHEYETSLRYLEALRIAIKAALEAVTSDLNSAESDGDPWE